MRSAARFDASSVPARVFTRIRYFFEDIGHWFTDRLRFRRRREQAGSSTDAAAKPARTERRRLRHETKATAKAEKKKLEGGAQGQ